MDRLAEHGGGCDSTDDEARPYGGMSTGYETYVMYMWCVVYDGAFVGLQ